jgi:sulfur relay (sulfurtransferase) DsrF/TusC family protein
MDGLPAGRLGLVVRNSPFQGRSARDQLDVALAAAAMGYSLDLFFIGQGGLQLLASHEPGAADLPRGSRGWKSLPGLTTVRAFVDPKLAVELAGTGQELLLETTVVSRAEMAERLASCDRALVL